jgi:carbonic anhydrase
MSEATMGSALTRNREFAMARGHEGLAMFPITLFVIACLDPRVDPTHVLGLNLGDAMIVRNGGGRVTTETIETVAFIAQVVEKFASDGASFEIAVVHHTQCGAAFLADDEFREQYAARIGVEGEVAVGLSDLAVVDPLATVRTDVAKLHAVSAMFPGATVYGHVYDVLTGLVDTVLPAEPVAATQARSA